MSRVPDTMRALATAEGIAPERVQGLWDRHRKWCQQQGHAELGGRPWQMLCRQASQDEDVPPVIEAEATLRQERERLEKEAADREYAKHAVSLQDWLDDLRVRDDFYEPMTVIERHIKDFRDPYPGEKPEEWLMEATKSAPRMQRMKPGSGAERERGR